MTTTAAAIAASGRSSLTEAAFRAVEAPVRRLAWHARTYGVVARTSVRIAAAGVLLGALVSIVWLAMSFFVAL